MKNKILLTLVLIVVSLGLRDIVFAQQAKKTGPAKIAPDAANLQWPKIEAVNKKITGEVSGVSNKFIAVVYGRNEKAKSALEMAFNIGSHVNIVNKKSLKEIGIGDTVEVEYQEITRTEADGRKSSKSIAQAVIFVKAGQRIEPVIPASAPAKAQAETPDSLKIKEYRN